MSRKDNAGGKRRKRLEGSLCVLEYCEGAGNKEGARGRPCTSWPTQPRQTHKWPKASLPGNTHIYTQTHTHPTLDVFPSLFFKSSSFSPLSLSRRSPFHHHTHTHSRALTFSLRHPHSNRRRRKGEKKHKHSPPSSHFLLTLSLSHPCFNTCSVCC